MDVRYFVNKDEGIVVCVLQNCQWDYLSKIRDHIEEVASSDVRMNQTFRGIAKCSPDDAFDEMYGKDLAFQRAYNKYFKNQKRIATKLIDKYLDYVGYLQEQITEGENKREKASLRFVE